ncbi:growth arrest-specific protein 7-like isoform X2 [Xyrauchen texanus]|uniref:growth arrest-specific protein 7-like isoform X2 n=1 Tax=Xyrauchen texanus TaxID=154827 RepID=UPI002241A302|nr:growth arrest-specific protein 7-like isoform X2 [Xyrauchen texanus]
MEMEESFDAEASFDDASCLSPQSPGSTSPARRQNKEKEIKETKITINCVTFPVPMSMPEQQLLKPNEWSYCDYFWADKRDPQGTTVSGFEVLLQKQLKGKHTQKEMAEFIRERIKIEEEYAKNLSKLSQFPMAAQEEGTLGEAWAQLKKSLADEAEVHLKFSSKLQSEVEKPLLNFRGDNFKKDMKKYDHHIADLRKQLVSRYAAVEKARKALADRQKDLEVKTQQLEIKLSNKTEEDIKKARRKSTQAGDDLMRCVDLYNQAQSKWFEEMVTTSMTDYRSVISLSLCSEGVGETGGRASGDDTAAPAPVHHATSRNRHVQPKYVGTSGPAPAECGPSQRQRVLG